MTNLPEKIWAYWDSLYEVFVVNTHGDPSYTPRPTTEYIRVDVAQAMVAAHDEAIRAALACGFPIDEIKPNPNYRAALDAMLDKAREGIPW